MIILRGRVMTTLVSSGIDGFDELVGGGFPAGKNIVVTGGPGTGKTIFSLQFIIMGILKYNEKGIFVTTEQSIPDIKRDALSFGWNLTAFEEQDKLRIINATPAIIPSVSKKEYVISEPHQLLGYLSFSPEDILSLIHDKRREINATRVAVDSLTHLMLYEENLFKARVNILRLINSLKSTNVTILSTAERMGGYSQGVYEIIPYVADGVVNLYMLREESRKIRACEILKMRGVKHSMDVVRMTITNEGIRVYPNEKIALEPGKLIYI
ncbi:MAG: hypothetical protein DRO67_07710 [Candidatus Asgardarchaeum californiense]|nr:MAG: hypothetical protein DRO67_07710 [Candidatus Asgardarchaeum californiense]